MQVKYSNIGSTEPITPAQVKEYCKIDYTDEDTLIGNLITGVRELIEEFTGLALIDKTVTVFWEDFEVDEDIELPFPEHNEITSVKVNGTAITDYISTGLTQKIIRVPSSYSVGTSSDNYGLEIAFTTLGTCPQAIKNEMLRLIDEKYRNRGNTFEGSIAELSENSYANLAQYCMM